MSKVSRIILVLVSGVLAWGTGQKAFSQPPPSPVLGATPIAGQPLIAPAGPPVWTGPIAPPPAACPEVHGNEFCFPKGAGTLEIMVGAYSKASIGPEVPTFDWLPVSIRLGRILDFPHWEGLFRGCYETLVEFTAAPIFNGFGHYLFGPSAIVRYNFVQPEWRVIPYYQMGVGFVYNDAYRDQTQRAVGQAIEFYLQAQIGFKWFVRDNLSLNLEAGFTHISNCNLAPRNLGINALGATIGATYYFPRCWKQ